MVPLQCAVCKSFLLGEIGAVRKQSISASRAQTEYIPEPPSPEAFLEGGVGERGGPRKTSEIYTSHLCIWLAARIL